MSPQIMGPIKRLTMLYTPEVSLGSEVHLGKHIRVINTPVCVMTRREKADWVGGSRMISYFSLAEQFLSCLISTLSFFHSQEKKRLESTTDNFP